MNKIFEEELLSETVTLEEVINAMHELSLNSNSKRISYTEIIEALIRMVKNKK